MFNKNKKILKHKQLITLWMIIFNLLTKPKAGTKIDKKIFYIFP